MTYRFVSGGKIDAASGEAVAEDPADAGSEVAVDSQRAKKNEEWAAVQRELDAERRQRELARAKLATGEERTLFDVLEANKAAKQAAFEEQSRLKNQFRPLDDDEVDFLAEVRAAKLADEAQLRRETEDGLRHFREAQAEREREAREKEEKERAEDREIEVESEDWGVGRKRKRERGRGLVRGVRRRVSSVSDAGEARKVVESKGPASGGGSAVEKEKEAVAGAVAPVTKPKPKAGLVAYGSDDDDDEDDEDG